MTKPLSDLIAETLTGSPSSAEVREILDKARREQGRLAGLREKLRTIALHPTTPAGEVRNARDKIADADFEAERMTNAVAALEEALGRAEAREEAASREAAYERALAERDAAAEELRRVYPEAAAAIAKALARVAASDAEVSKLNRTSLPAGRAWIDSVEHVVRGVTENGAVIGPNGVPTVSRTSSLVDAVNLPALSGADAATGSYIWRKGSKGTSAAAAVAA